MANKTAWGVVILMATITAGCNQTTSPAPQKPGADGSTPDPVALAEGRRALLEQEPAGAIGVLETRKQAQDGDAVVVVGRIAGSREPFVSGRCSFSITDLSIMPCAEGEGCPTPWDCCCTPKEELLPATAQVKFVDANGKSLNAGAKEVFGVKELTVVVIKGKAARDESGNLTVIGNGLYARPEKNNR